MARGVWVCCRQPRCKGNNVCNCPYPCEVCGLYSIMCVPCVRVPCLPPPPPLMHPIVDTIPLDQLWVPFRMKTYVGEEASAPAAVPVGAMQASVSACACVCACGQCVCMRVCMCFACLQQLQEVCRHAYDVAVSGRSVVFCDM